MNSDNAEGKKNKKRKEYYDDEECKDFTAQSVRNPGPFPKNKEKKNKKIKNSSD